jgi:hypothetical protein
VRTDRDGDLLMRRGGASGAAAPRRPRLLFVGDHRDALNWGCRATSIALRLMLAERFEIAGALNKATLDGRIRAYVPRRGWPRSALRHGIGFVDRAEHAPLRQLVAPVIRSLLTRRYMRDVIDSDPVASVARFLATCGRHPQLREMMDAFAEADAVVINGEGSMIFTTPSRRDLSFQLFAIELAATLGKPVAYVNAMVSDCPVHGRDDRMHAAAMRALAKCAGIALRDPESMELVQPHLSGTPLRFVPDAVFGWFGPRIDRAVDALRAQPGILAAHPESDALMEGLDLAEPYLCVSASSACSRRQAEARPAYARMVRALAELGLPVIVVQTCTGESFLAEVAVETGVPFVPVATNLFAGAALLAGASAFVSGRFHPSILASIGGTPCVFLGSNSHKTRSIQRVLGRAVTEHPAIPSTRDVTRIIEEVRFALDAGERLRATMRSAADHAGREARGLGEFVARCLGARDGVPRQSRPMAMEAAA